MNTYTRPEARHRATRITRPTRPGADIRALRAEFAAGRYDASMWAAS